MIETTKKAFYAAVGAPVVVTKRANEAFEELTNKVKDLRSTLSEDVRKQFAAWTEEGERVVTRVSHQPVVEDITSRLDFDSQVGKLREQLDDILASWRKNFRPPAEKIEVESAPKHPAAETAPAAKQAAETAAAPKPAAKKPATKKATATKKPAAKKATTARKPAAKASA